MHAAGACDVNESLRFTRRDLLRGSFLVLPGPALAGAALAGRAAADDGPRPKVRVGLVTDL